MELVKVGIHCKRDMAIDTVLKCVHVFLVFLFGAHEEWGFPLVACLTRNMVLLYSVMLGTVETKLNRKRSLYLV